MKRLFLLTLSLCFTLTTLVVQGQSIRAVNRKTPEVSKTATGSTPTTYTGHQVMVGSGGGMTGLSTTYYLLDDGKLFVRRSRDTAFTFIGQQTIANTKRVFTVAQEKCKIETAKFDKPGNIYTFIGWRKGKRKNEVTWGATDKTVPAIYPKFYDSFMAMIPAASRLN
ncbi:FAD-binding oxidoreductase [Spirosoma flavum]|uniref:FAD-binding oxidoreductase n=1 Tax=Spirosoma flavum TaxID=2048557 RepID=A0ABW6AF05_9BACT